MHKTFDSVPVDKALRCQESDATALDAIIGCRLLSFRHQAAMKHLMSELVMVRQHFRTNAPVNYSLLMPTMESVCSTVKHVAKS